jgi:hypothetical protein
MPFGVAVCGCRALSGAIVCACFFALVISLPIKKRCVRPMSQERDRPSITHDQLERLMLPNNTQADTQADNTVVGTRIATRRKLLTSLIAGSGAFVLAACGGGGDGATPDSVADRWRRRNNGGASTATPASSASSTTTASAAVRRSR